MSDGNDKTKKQENDSSSEDDEVTLTRKGTMGRTVADAQEFLSDFDPSSRKRKRDEKEKEMKKLLKEAKEAERLSPTKKKKRSVSPKRSVKPRRSLSPKKKQTTPRAASPKKKNNNNAASSPPPKKKRMTRSTSPKKGTRVTRKSPVATNVPTTFGSTSTSTATTSGFSYPTATPRSNIYNTNYGSSYISPLNSGFSSNTTFGFSYPSVDQLTFWIPHTAVEGNYNQYLQGCWSSKSLTPTWSFKPTFTSPSSSSSNNNNNAADTQITIDDAISAHEPPVTTATTTTTTPSTSEEVKRKVKKAAFGLTVSSYGKVWIGNDNGDVYGFSLDGEMKRRIKLPSGIKSIVADMDNWLYAGCDDGVVYDLSREKEVRIAYEIDSSISLDKQEEIEFLSGSVETRKRNHFLFVVDKSGSMAGSRIRAAMQNIRMIYDQHVKDDDYISLIEFSSTVNIRCSKWQKSNEKQRVVMEKFFFSTKSDHVCGGATALWDAINESLNILTLPSYVPTTTTSNTSTEFSTSDQMQIESANKNTQNGGGGGGEGGNEIYDDFTQTENWVICLTDGEDNSSRKTNYYNLFERFKSVASSVKTIGIGVGLSSYGAPLKSICSLNPTSLYIPVEAGNAAEGITEAFKLVTQVLSARIISMDIRDGLIAVSDNRGNISACDIEAHPTWTKKSNGLCGWMIKADFEGIYHGHSLGITKYTPFDGNKLWERTFSAPILYGFLDRKNNVIYASAGSNVYAINSEDGSVKGYYKCPGPVICNAFDYDKQRIFAVDKVGNLVCFDLSGKILFLVKFPKVLSMQYFKEKLFLTTTKGELHCIDVSDSAIIPALTSNPPPPSTPTLQVRCLESLEVTTPTTSIPSRSKSELDEDDVIVECYQEFDDSQILSISQSLHDSSISMITVNGKEYAVEVHAPTSARYYKISRLTFLQHRVVDDVTAASFGPEYVEVNALVRDHNASVTWVLNGEKEIEKRGLVVNADVRRNGSHLLIRPLPNQKGGFDSSKIVQFPRSIRSVGTFYSVQNLSLSENAQYYRSFGEIAIISDYDVKA